MRMKWRIGSRKVDSVTSKVRDASDFDALANQAIRDYPPLFLGVFLICFGFLVPVMMVLANRSAAFFLVFTVATAYLGLFFIKRSPEADSAHGLQFIRALIVQTLRHKLLLCLVLLVCALFVIYALLSMGWSIAPFTSLREILAVTPVFLATLFGVFLLPLLLRAHRLAIYVLLVGIVCASLLIVFEWKSGMGLHLYFGQRTDPNLLKRSALVLAFLIWPSLAFLNRTTPNWFGRTLHHGLRFLLVTLVLVASILAHSVTAVVALVMGGLVYCAASLFPRAATLALLFLMASALVFAPMVARNLITLAPSFVLESQTLGNIGPRLKIYRAFGTRVSERPLLGFGFGTAADVGLSPHETANTSAPNSEDDNLIANIHSHNIFLQANLELGLVGVGFGLVFLVLLGIALFRIDEAVRPPRLAFIASVLVVGMVWAGLWQAWWLAMIAIGSFWFLAVPDGLEASTEGLLAQDDGITPPLHQ